MRERGRMTEKEREELGRMRENEKAVFGGQKMTFHCLTYY